MALTFPLFGQLNVHVQKNIELARHQVETDIFELLEIHVIDRFQVRVALNLVNKLLIVFVKFRITARIPFLFAFAEERHEDALRQFRIFAAEQQRAEAGPQHRQVHDALQEGEHHGRTQLVERGETVEIDQRVWHDNVFVQFVLGHILRQVVQHAAQGEREERAGRIAADQNAFRFEAKQRLNVWRIGRQPEISV